MPAVCIEKGQQGHKCLLSRDAAREAVCLKPLGGTCSTCGSVCSVPQACEIAEVQPIRRRLFADRSREWTGRAIGAALGLAGLIFIAVKVGGLW